MENQEEKLINEIRSLFEELIEEEKENFDTATMRIIYPRSFVYVSKAKDLFAKAVELEKVNSEYHTDGLKDVMADEVDMVDRYEYEYKKNSLTPKAKSITKMQNLMHDATYHIKLYFYKVLGDIEIN